MKENTLLKDLKTEFQNLSAVRILALDNDTKLLSFLLERSQNKEEFKRRFFEDLGKALIFKKESFLQFLDLHTLNKSYTSFINKIGLLNKNTKQFLRTNDEVVLNFAFKDCVLKGSQTKDESKTEELFFNEILAESEIDVLFAPKALHNFELCDYQMNKNNEIMPYLKDSPNLLIKGNNLLALHSLKHRKDIYAQVKLIYIDPPYNTGNDSFNYNDNFNHSTYLCFMKNRLEIAREFLRDDGVIFIQCDDNEQAYLKVLCDEVFGREEFVNCIALRVSPPMGVKITHANKTILKEKEYLLCFKKNQTTFNPQYVALKKWDSHYNIFIENRDDDIEHWKMKPLGQKLKEIGIKKADLDDKDFVKWIYQNLNKVCQLIVPTNAISKNQKYLEKKIQRVVEVDKESYAYNGKTLYFINNLLFDTLEGKKLGILLCDLWTDIGFNNLFQEGYVNLKNGKKPEALLKRIIEISTREGDLVMDFFAGSGTTLAVAHKMNRRYVGIEQMDYIETITKERLKKVVNGEQGGVSKQVGWKGGGRFCYCELMPLNILYKKEIIEASKEQELEKLYKILKEKAFIDYRVDIQEILKDKDFQALDFDNKKAFLLQSLDSNMDYVLFGDLEDKDLQLSKELIALNKAFYEKVKKS